LEKLFWTIYDGVRCACRGAFVAQASQPCSHCNRCRPCVYCRGP
jgi:hypothetical protein